MLRRGASASRAATPPGFKQPKRRGYPAESKQVARLSLGVKFPFDRHVSMITGFLKLKLTMFHTRKWLLSVFPCGTGNDEQPHERKVIGVTDVTYSRLSADNAAGLMDRLCEVYADAYGEVPGENTNVKTDAFRDRANGALGARNYGLVTAWVGDELVGFVFGYSLRQEREWFAGLDPAPEPGFTDERGGERTVVLAEIEVRKAWQGKGIGRGLQDAFLSGRPEERATLTANPAATAIHALYEGWGWQRIGTIPGRPGAYYREYAVFVRPLPLTGRQ